MYSKILKELKEARNTKEIYSILRGYTRELNLTYGQVEYLLYQFNN